VPRSPGTSRPRAPRRCRDARTAGRVASYPAELAETEQHGEPAVVAVHLPQRAARDASQDQERARRKQRDRDDERGQARADTLVAVVRQHVALDHECERDQRDDGAEEVGGEGGAVELLREDRRRLP
jgi:hypothetical protein